MLSSIQKERCEAGILRMSFFAVRGYLTPNRGGGGWIGFIINSHSKARTMSLAVEVMQVSKAKKDSYTAVA